MSYGRLYGLGCHEENSYLDACGLLQIPGSGVHATGEYRNITNVSYLHDLTAVLAKVKQNKYITGFWALGV